MCWPIWVFDASFVIIDTQSYLKAGEAIMRVLLEGALDVVQDTLAFGTDETGAAAQSAQQGAGGLPNLTVGQDGGSTVGRSFTYSAGIYILYISAGVWSIPFVQAFIIALFLVALVPAGSSYVNWIGISLVCLLSTLPWYAVLLSPDIFAAAPILFAALLVGPLKHARPVHAWIIVGLAALCVTFHYGYPPLAAGACTFSLAWLLFHRAFAWRYLAMVSVVVLTGPALNYVASGLVLDAPSTSPQRLPIPLARSLQDGPARWYLEEACPSAGLAMCDAFESEIPDNVAAFLWESEGVLSLDPELLARIRDEEFKVLASAFRAYPLQQTYSLSKNAITQFFQIGTNAVRAAEIVEPGYALTSNESKKSISQWARNLSPTITWLTWLASLPCLLLLVSGRLGRTESGMLLAVLFGLCINAAVFGGLSAPDARYQSRIVWLLPLASALLPVFYSSTSGRKASAGK